MYVKIVLALNLYGVVSGHVEWYSRKPWPLNLTTIADRQCYASELESKRCLCFIHGFGNASSKEKALYTFPKIHTGNGNSSKLK
jgi:putative SOS response-associated peptidase YedK